MNNNSTIENYYIHLGILCGFDATQKSKQCNKSALVPIHCLDLMRKKLIQIPTPFLACNMESYEKVMTFLNAASSLVVHSC